MRLLNVYTFHFQEFPDEREAPPYIIASHRWSDDEVTYQQFLLGDESSDIRARAGYKKIRRFCRFVRSCRTDQGRRVKWLWIDTICINKSDFSELHEAINCMFRWYQSAYVCIAYLHDVPHSTAKQYHLERSEWFRRGWTLQELVAPRFVFFTNKDWAPIGFKGPLAQTTLRREERAPFLNKLNEFEALGPNLNQWISHATTIPEKVLLNYSTAESLSVADKRAWMTNRKCTRVEDESYCLLGLCGVYMSLIYGERERAATRLDEEILRQSQAHLQPKRQESAVQEDTKPADDILRERISRPYGMSHLRSPHQWSSGNSKDANEAGGKDSVPTQTSSIPIMEEFEATSRRPGEALNGTEPQSHQAPSSVNNFTARFRGRTVRFTTGPAAGSEAFEEHFEDFPAMSETIRDQARGRSRDQTRQRKSSSTVPMGQSDASYHYFDDDGRQTRPSPRRDSFSCSSSSRSPSPIFHSAERSGRDSPVRRARHDDNDVPRKNLRSAAGLLFGIAAVSSLLKTREESDIPHIVDIQFSAFEGDPYQEALFPGDYYSTETRRGAQDRTLSDWNSDLTARWIVCINEETQALLGFALWNVYSQPRPASEWQKLPEVDWCEGRQKEIASNFLNMNAQLRQKIWEGRPYVLLNLLCVHQDHQRRGVGRMLVQWGIELAKSLDLSIHLEASVAGYHLYRKIGFRQVDAATVKAEEWDGDHDRTYIAMVKDPDARTADHPTEAT